MPANFNLVEITALLKLKWKTVFVFAIATSIAATIAVFTVTPKYESAITVLAANSVLSDKARIFNQQIKDLYGNFGNGDDLDRIIGIAELDTTLKKVIETYQLVNYYQINEQDNHEAIEKALVKLKKDLTLTKTPKDQLIIYCLSKDKKLAAAIPNAIIQFTNEQLKSITKKNLELVIQQLDTASNTLRKEFNSLSTSSASGAEAALDHQEANTILAQLDQYKKTSQEYLLALQTIPSAIEILSPAREASIPTWPNKPVIIIMAALAGALFAILLLINNNRSNLL